MFTYLLNLKVYKLKWMTKTFRKYNMIINKLNNFKQDPKFKVSLYFKYQKPCKIDKVNKVPKDNF